MSNFFPADPKRQRLRFDARSNSISHALNVDAVLNLVLVLFYSWYRRGVPVFVLSAGSNVALSVLWVVSAHPSSCVVSLARGVPCVESTGFRRLSSNSEGSCVLHICRCPSIHISACLLFSTSSDLNQSGRDGSTTVLIISKYPFLSLLQVPLVVSFWLYSRARFRFPRKSGTGTYHRPLKANGPLARRWMLSKSKKKFGGVF